MLHIFTQHIKVYHLSLTLSVCWLNIYFFVKVLWKESQFILRKIKIIVDISISLIPHKNFILYCILHAISHNLYFKASLIYNMTIFHNIKTVRYHSHINNRVYILPSNSFSPSKIIPHAITISWISKYSLHLFKRIEMKYDQWKFPKCIEFGIAFHYNIFLFRVVYLDTLLII